MTEPYPLKRDVATDRVRHPEHERAVECAGCHQTILVCGFVDDLPERYRCLECRSAVDERAVTLGDAIDRAKRAAGVET